MAENFIPNTGERAAKPFMTGCCTCGRLLKTDGTLAAAVVIKGGIFDLSAAKALGDSPEGKDLATFATVADAETRLLEVGFTVENGNHRCPWCQPQKYVRRGLMIDLREVFA